MNVIVVNDHLYADGGADVVALSSAEQLAAAGTPVTLFVADALRPDDRTERKARLVCTGQSDLLRDPRPGRAALQGLWNLTAARKMRALLAEHDPADTVVHLHSWTKSLSSSVVREARDAGFPLVCTLHDYFSVCPTGALYNFQTNSICRLDPMSGQCIRTHCDARRYTHKLYRVARHVVQSGWGGLPGELREFIVVSRFSEAILRPHLPVDARVVHVRNPIEIEPAAATDLSANHAVVMVARPSRYKGVELFLHACELAEVDAVCIGDGPERVDLEGRFPRARFTGQLNRAAVSHEMRKARALVLPSLLYETQGLVVDEAAALGVPAIVADTCAATDSVAHERTGLVFKSADVGSLAQALRRMVDEPGLAVRLGAAAHERFWRDPPTPQAHARDLMQVYAGVLDRANGRSSPRPPPTASLEQLSL